jgi:hypothetical protein
MGASFLAALMDDEARFLSLCFARRNLLFLLYIDSIVIRESIRFSMLTHKCAGRKYVITKHGGLRGQEQNFLV